MLAKHIMIGLALVLAVPGLAQAQYTRGDLNCDGSINSLDIDPFVLAVSDQVAYGATYPDCNCLLGDCNFDGFVNSLDIDPFVQCVTCSCPPVLPEMVHILGGEFEMGDPWGEGDADELPVHDVYVNPFYMDINEITNEQYCAYLNSAYGRDLIEITSGIVYKAGGTSYPYCDTHPVYTESRIHWDGNKFTVTTGADHPMVMVSWYGAVAYSNWRSDQHGHTPCYNLDTWECNFSASGYRLPTEAEWEKAAGWDPIQEQHFRFGEHTDGCGYNCLDEQRANYWVSDDPFETGDYPWTTPKEFYNGELHHKVDFDWPGSATSYQTQDAKSYYGCYDMSGNVWEWCHDWYDSDYYDTYLPDDWPPNPTGPSSGTYRVLRGGSWDFTCGSGCIDFLRSAQRDRNPIEYCDYHIGFRCAVGTP